MNKTAFEVVRRELNQALFFAKKGEYKDALCILKNARSIRESCKEDEMVKAYSAFFDKNFDHFEKMIKDKIAGK